jgi:CDP-4-dehydro-6-deoxyglucose reductase
MPKLLSLSRAARLAGVSRGDLQHKIRNEELATFEGQIQMSDLLRAYPHIDVEGDPVFERVQAIKTEARPRKSYSDGWMPDPEVLMSRLKEFQRVLVETKGALNASRALMGDVAKALEFAAQAPERELREAVAELGDRLTTAMAEPPEISDVRAQLFAKDALLKIMAAGVRIHPSGHEFFVEGSDSILEAALKAGLHLEYGCSSGVCGTCKARVASGSVRKTCDHDFVLSARERESGYILTCSNTAVTDLVLEASEALTPQDLPHQEIRASVRRVEPVGEDLALLRVQTPRTHTLRFMAGQRVELTTEDGAAARMPIASCPCDGRNLHFLVRRDPDDAFAREVFGEGMASQTLQISGPEGRFTLREESAAPAVFVAVGDGYAAIKSLVEHVIAIDNVVRIHLYRLEDSGPGNLLDNHCRAWTDALENFAYSPLALETQPAELLQRLLADQRDLPECDVYVAGPGRWVEGLLQAADEAALDTRTWLTDASDRSDEPSG